MCRALVDPCVTHSSTHASWTRRPMRRALVNPCVVHSSTHASCTRPPMRRTLVAPCVVHSSTHASCTRRPMRRALVNTCVVHSSTHASRCRRRRNPFATISAHDFYSCVILKYLFVALGRGVPTARLRRTDQVLRACVSQCWLTRCLMAYFKIASCFAKLYKYA